MLRENHCHHAWVRPCWSQLDSQLKVNLQASPMCDSGWRYDTYICSFQITIHATPTGSSEKSDDDIQADSDYSAPQSKKRSQNQMSAGHKENSTSAEPMPATSQFHEDNDTIAKEIPKKRRKYHGAQHLHHLAFKGHPETDCTADHPNIQGTNSLCWTFLKLTDAVHDAHQSLVSGVITCAFCIKDGKLWEEGWEFLV